MNLLVSALIAATALAAPPKQVQLTGPFGPLVEPKGTLLVPDGASGRIVRVDPKTGRRTGLSGVAVARNGTLYATSFYAPFVGRLTAAGALKAFPAR